MNSFFIGRNFLCAKVKPNCTAMDLQVELFADGLGFITKMWYLKQWFVRYLTSPDMAEKQAEIAYLKDLLIDKELM